MSWGKSIVVAFTFFALFIGVLVTVCLKQEVNLVSRDYYNEELKYQEQIDEMKNVNLLAEKPTIVVREKHIEVFYSSGLGHGALKLIRPSDARFDVSFAVDSARSFDMSQYPPGRYNASLRWEEDGKRYLLQQPVDL